jgi:hypothetical protein
MKLGNPEKTAMRFNHLMAEIRLSALNTLCQIKKKVYAEEGNSGLCSGIIQPQIKH